MLPTRESKPRKAVRGLNNFMLLGDPAGTVCGLLFICRCSRSIGMALPIPSGGETILFKMPRGIGEFNDSCLPIAKPAGGRIWSSETV